MTLQLLSPFKTFPDRYCDLSNSGKRNNSIVANLNCFYSNKAILLLTVGWILFQLFSYSSLSLRPTELFHPTNYFGKIFMPSFPSRIVYYSIGILSISLITYIFTYRDSIFIRLAITFSLLWLNLIKYSFGHQGHTGHLLILAHLFAILIPFNQIKSNKHNQEIYQTTEWYYLGILVTYFFSGFWKTGGLIFKLIFKKTELNWLSPDASLYTAIVGRRELDLPTDHIAQFYSFPLFWQLSFLFATFVLTFSFLAAYRQPLKIWAALALIIFHIVNIIAFNVYFYSAQLVLLCLFFPYEILFKKYANHVSPIQNTKFSGTKANALYERVYQNGDKDRFTGYYAYRENIIDNYPIAGGLLYIPFIDVIINNLWKSKAIYSTKLS